MKKRKRTKKRLVDNSDAKRLPKPAKKKPKAFAGRPATGKSPAHSFAEFAVIERRPSFVPHAHYWCGGGIVQRLVIPAGWQLASPHPGPEYRIAALRSVPTPDGPVRLAQFLIRDEVRERMAARCAATIAEEQEFESAQQRNRQATERILTRVCGGERKR